MHGTAWQGSIGGARRHMVLVGQLGPQQGSLRSVNVGQHHRHRFVPPGQPTQVGLVAVKVAARQVHAGQHGAHGRAVHALWGQLALAAQLVDHGGGLAAHGVQDVTVFVSARVGHGHAAVRQMLHQVQVERQLLGREALEQRQHELALVAGQKVVGVLDAALNAAQLHQLAQLQTAQQLARLGIGDFGKNGHRSGGRRKKKGKGRDNGRQAGAQPVAAQCLRTTQQSLRT